MNIAVPFILSSWARRGLKVTLVLLLSVSLLTTLFMRAESVSPQAHYDYTKVLRDLREADAKIDGEVLANRLEITRNYDALTLFLKNAQYAASRITVIPSFLESDDKKVVIKQARELQLKIEKKSQLIEVFKRENAVLRNSLAYFPSAADTFLSERMPSDLRAATESYARHILSFARNPDAERHLQVEAARKQLIATPALQAKREVINNLLLHGDAILKFLPDVDRVMNSLRNFSTAQHMGQLSLQYALGHEHAQKTAGQFRKLLYGVALFLAAYLAFFFVRLDRTRYSLFMAHQEVSQRYAAQLIAEDRLRLHATAFHNSHDGIMLADAKGHVLDINPAFTRITGFERAEVIGRNPKVVKSGRHPPEFYAAMWKSILGSGSWQGEIWNRNKYGEIYPELLSISAVRDSSGELTNFVGVFSDISRLKEQEIQLTKMAYYDALTELPNRVLLADRLIQAMSQAKRSETLLAVCYLDLDGFKPVNDTYGHEVGDRVLVEMADRLRGILRGGDTIARLGGDEFVLLLGGLNDLSECEQAIQRWLQVISQPLEIVTEPISLSASAGVTVFPTGDADPDTLLRQADQAMYQAKQSGKNRFHMFDHELDSHVRIQHDHMGRIEEALQSGEFSLYYQPKVDMRKGDVIGMEALIRWHHPERGLIAPADFLPFVEDHDLIIRIGEWVIETALCQINTWHDLGLDLPISINIAGRQLQDASFMQYLSTSLSKYSYRANTLELEILETSALEDMSKASKIIEQCRELGVSCSLDDFGTGYSSLTYLKRLPAGTIKIDQSFVCEMISDPDNFAIVQGVLGLASAFQREVIAEGVESIAHGKLLMQLGCDHAQGYGIARPMPATQVSAWVDIWCAYPEWSAIKNLYWDTTDQPLLAAKVEHQSLVVQLIHAVKEGQAVPKKCLADPHDCSFGIWYHGRGAKLYRNHPDFVQINAPHQRVHELAKEIDNHMRNARIEQAKILLEDLLIQRDAVLKALDGLETEVAQSI